MKATVYAHKVNAREELLLRILSAARSINNAVMIRTVTSSFVTRDRNFIQADRGHFEQLVWVSNGESVAVHLTRYFNKYTMLLFSFRFIYCILNITTPESLRIGPMCIWGFWLRISCGTNSRNIGLNFSDTLYFHLWNFTLSRTVLHYVIKNNFSGKNWT